MTLRDKITRAKRLYDAHESGKTYKQIAAEEILSVGRVMDLVHMYENMLQRPERLQEDLSDKSLHNNFPTRIANQLAWTNVNDMDDVDKLTDEDIERLRIGAAGKKALREYRGFDMLPSYIYLTKEEIAKKFNIPVNLLKIKRK